MQRAKSKVAFIILTLLVFTLGASPVMATAGQWSASGSVIYYSDGNVGLGTSSPVSKLEIAGSSSSVEFTSLSLANIPNRNWVFLNGEYGNTTNGDYALTIRQPGYSDCLGCKGDLVLRPGKNVIIPYQSLGIGTSNPGTYKLAVNGSIRAKAVYVDNSAWADYVFDEDYALLPLSELENYIKVNKHLPNIPSAYEVESKGISLGDMQKLQMEKIEELTLYTIRQDKSIETLRQENEQLKNKNEELEARLERLEALLK